MLRELHETGIKGLREPRQPWRVVLSDQLHRKGSYVIQVKLSLYPLILLCKSFTAFGEGVEHSFDSM